MEGETELLDKRSEYYPSLNGVNLRKIGVYVLAATLMIWLLASQIQLSNSKKTVQTLQMQVMQANKNSNSTLNQWGRDQIYEWGRAELIHLKNITDFKDFSIKLRHLKTLFMHYEATIDPMVSDADYSEMPVLGEMETLMFPWAFQYFSTLLQLKRSFNGPGIVIPTGSHHFRMAVFLVKTLRELGCTLPISIAHGGIGDLKAQELFYLYQLRVSALDVSQYVDTQALELKGWQIKPFAMLVAPYTEVILMDADVVLMQNPEAMLQDKGYQEHGAVFFRDRTLFDKDWKKTKWLEENLPLPLSEQVKETRMYQQISGHEQESGIVVINKAKRLFTLLAACKLNGKIERDQVVYKEFYGDKETFWIGAAMANETYTTLWPRAGVIGHVHDLPMIQYEKALEEAKRDKKPRPKKPKAGKGPAVVCGRIAHFDRNGEPLWFNGGIVLDKGDEKKRDYLNTFTHYAHEGKWEFITGCIIDEKPIELPTNTSNILKALGRSWRPKINLVDIDNFHLRT